MVLYSTAGRLRRVRGLLMLSSEGAPVAAVEDGQGIGGCQGTVGSEKPVRALRFGDSICVRETDEDWTDDDDSSQGSSGGGGGNCIGTLACVAFCERRLEKRGESRTTGVTLRDDAKGGGVGSRAAAASGIVFWHKRFENRGPPLCSTYVFIASLAFLSRALRRTGDIVSSVFAGEFGSSPFFGVESEVGAVSAGVDDRWRFLPAGCGVIATGRIVNPSLDAVAGSMLPFALSWTPPGTTSSCSPAESSASASPLDPILFTVSSAIDRDRGSVTGEFAKDDGLSMSMSNDWGVDFDSAARCRFRFVRFVTCEGPGVAFSSTGWSTSIISKLESVASRTVLSAGLAFSDASALSLPSVCVDVPADTPLSLRWLPPASPPLKRSINDRYAFEDVRCEAEDVIRGRCDAEGMSLSCIGSADASPSSSFGRSSDLDAPFLVDFSGADGPCSTAARSFFLCDRRVVDFEGTGTGRSSVGWVSCVLAELDPLPSSASDPFSAADTPWRTTVRSADAARRGVDVEATEFNSSSVELKFNARTFFFHTRVPGTLSASSPAVVDSDKGGDLRDDCEAETAEARGGDSGCWEVEMLEPASSGVDGLTLRLGFGLVDFGGELIGNPTVPDASAAASLFPYLSRTCSNIAAASGSSDRSALFLALLFSTPPPLLELATGLSMNWISGSGEGAGRGVESREERQMGASSSSLSDITRVRSMASSCDIGAPQLN
jgi:hypothetical protein